MLIKREQIKNIIQKLCKMKKLQKIDIKKLNVQIKEIVVRKEVFRVEIDKIIAQIGLEQ